MNGNPASAAQSVMRSTLEQFSRAWLRGDIDALMALMSDAPTYKNSSGSTFEGREAVRAAFTAICRPPATGAPAAGAPAATEPPGTTCFFDDKCLSYWYLTLPSPGGEPRRVAGIDVLTFDADGRIRIKDAYRKLA